MNADTFSAIDIIKTMKESDWKIFKRIKEKAIQTFCEQALEEFEGVITDETKRAHDRYLMLYKMVRERDRQMESLFDGHSRSRAPLQLLVLRREGLADEELLGMLSEEFRASTDPDNLEW